VAQVSIDQTGRDSCRHRQSKLHDAVVSAESHCLHRGRQKTNILHQLDNLHEIRDQNLKISMFIDSSAVITDVNSEEIKSSKVCKWVSILKVDRSKQSMGNSLNIYFLAQSV